MKREMEPYQLIERSIIKKYRKELWTPFIVAVKRYELIKAGDKIAVCISGGKDSMLMAKLMQELQRHSDVPFELVFLVMDPGYNEINRQKIESNAELLHIPVTIFESNIFSVANNTDKNPCYLCARMRRGHLYSKAKEMGCNKIALGHHFNDVIETTVMSMFYGSQLQAMPPMLHSTSFPGMTLIRPMYCIREEDILAWKRYNELEFIQCACRFTENCTMCDNGGGGSKRQETKILLRRLKRDNPNIENSIFRSLLDIAEKETEKSSTNKTGFSHNPAGYTVKFYNGSTITTLNSKPDSIRGKRATLLFFDEAAFCSDELIAACEPFTTQDGDFVTDTDKNYNPETQARKAPNQLVYASSQDTMDKVFYKYYKDFAKKMIAGNRDYFVCDMICDVAIHVYMNGEPYKPLLSQDKVDAALKTSREKAMREYYNKPSRDGGVNQIVKWGTVRRNERKYLPQLYWDKQYKYVIAFDPARTMDNSIVSIMRIYNDPENGMCGDIINCVNMVDLANSKKYKMDSNRQIEELRELILHYNGQNPDYEYIDSLMIDQGAGGGGTSTYADGLLNNWTDKSGTEHRGFIDANHELYEGYDARYPDAVDKLRLISPRKFRSVMFEELIELMNLGVVHFPLEYNGGDYVQVVDGVDKATGQEILKTHELSLDEQTAWVNIDLMKNEITSMQKTTNPENTSVTYALPPDRANKMHDDRAYTLVLLAHRLYELRRKDKVRQSAVETMTTPPICISNIDF